MLRDVPLKIQNPVKGPWNQQRRYSVVVSLSNVGGGRGVDHRFVSDNRLVVITKMVSAESSSK